MIVVTLGHRLTSPTIHPELQQRVETGIDALRALDASYLLCSGGRGNEAIARTESEVMQEYARSQGVDEERILLEDESVDTIGNGYYTRRLLADRGIDPETIVLVTSDYHMERALYVFEQCFGDAAALEPEACETSVTDVLGYDETSNETKLERTRAFFEPVTAGDFEMIERRLVDEHDCYTREHVPPRP
ncbi:YdcF family protein [Natronococcus pandeyae]|uniref:YdcF family protein n=1 Tax=Natronococcus pandeyae TaxID=2055836 RepID=A0A8J8TQ82_9EURY|nr:YdcF family protein [Natronococcus pandeyae]TYL38198.1 YdcF family protein [Natronococcus pandeyae]